MVLAQGVQLNVFNNHHLVVIFPKHGTLQNLLGIHFIALG